MVLPVGGSYYCWFTAHHVRSVASTDAYEKAGTLHRDVSLGNLILSRLEEGAERVGYLIDWELSYKPNKGTGRNHMLTVRLILFGPSGSHDVRLKGTPAFMSIGALLGDEHGLKDDMESFIYVVLYAALRWLPVQPSQGLDWWMTRFFSAPQADGSEGGADLKMSNAMCRRYASDLSSTESQHIVNWLAAAMDLHCKDRVFNPGGIDGMALGEMWEEVLAMDLPTNCRVVNPIPGMKAQDDGSLHPMFTAATSTQDLHRSRNEPIPLHAPTPIKRSRSHSMVDSALLLAQKPQKRPRTGRRPQTRSTSAGNRGEGESMAGVDSAATSSGDTGTLTSEGGMHGSLRPVSQRRGVTRTIPNAGTSTSGAL